MKALSDTYGHPTEHEFKPAAKINERCAYFVSIFALWPEICWTLTCSGTVVIQYKSSDNFLCRSWKTKFSRSQWSHFPGKADQSRRGDPEWGGHQLSSATLALRCLLMIISMITMLMMEVMTIATLDLFVGDDHVKFLLSCQTENFLALDIDITWNFLLIQGSDHGTTWKR